MKETILVVEDHLGVRTVARRMLTRHGYHVLVAEDGVQALEISRGYEGEIALLMTDVQMPVMGGPEVARILCDERPQLRVLFASGNSEPIFLDSEAPEPTPAFLQKPYTSKALGAKVREILDGVR